MKRLPKPTKPLGVIHEFAKFASAHGLSIQDNETDEAFLNYVRAALANEARAGTVVHGLRCQAMFVFVAQALGACLSITEEDAGHFAGTASHEKQRPDYRVVTSTEVFFVEVKNCYQKQISQPFTIKKEYANRLTAYAELHKLPLNFAVYWSRCNIWTLTPLRVFKAQGTKLVLNILDAMTYTEMVKLGDRHIGLMPPAFFRLYTDPEHPTTFDESGKGTTRVRSASIFVGGVGITDAFERQLAAYFMLYGNWFGLDTTTNNRDGRTESFDFAIRFSDDDLAAEGEIPSLCSLSSMAASRFRELTRFDERVSGIYTPHDPSAVCPLLIECPAWKQLRIAYATMEPKSS